MKTRVRVTAIPALIAAGFLASIPGALKVAAQHDHGTPETGTNPYADLGLPELNLVQTGDAIEGMPETLEAGRYLLTVTGEGEPGPDDYAIGAMLLQLPEGLTLDAAMEQAGANPDAPPPFFYESVLAGGAGAIIPAGQTSATSVIDLPPGNWIVAGQALSRPPVPFTVTGEMPADLVEPPSTATITLDEMTIVLSAGELVAGDNQLKVENVGAQPHFVEFMGVPDGTTQANVEAAIQAEMGGTPEAEPVDMSQAVPVAYISEQSTDTTVWTTVHLDAGTYAAMCWVPDPETGIPHAMSGMHEVFVVV